MEQIQLQARFRDTGKGPSSRLRREGYVPAIIYGGGMKSVAIGVRGKDLVRALSTEAGMNALLRLEIEGDDPRESCVAMVKELQREPVTGKVVHADMYRVSLEKKVHTRVPVTVVGEAARDKDGRTLRHLLHQVEVECLPTEIPEHFTVDVRELDLGDQVFVRDLDVPAGIKILTGPDELVLSIVPPEKVEEEAEEKAQEAVPGEPEVVGRERARGAREGEGD